MAVKKEFDLTKLNRAAYNPRSISPAAKAGLDDALTTFGVLDMPVVNVKDGRDRLIAGHQRVELLLAKNVKWCDCIAVSFDDEKEIAANLTLNNQAIQGTFDVRKALPQLESIRKNLKKPDSMGMATLLDQVRRESQKITAKESQSKSADTAPETSVKPVSRPQMTYKLNGHRLYCGSFEVGAPKLLGSTCAHACVTDPPYNVDYAGWQDAHEKIENDELAPDKWAAFVRLFVNTALKFSDGPCYLFMSSRELPSLWHAWQECGGVVHRTLVWAKDKITSAHRGDYHFSSEPILFGYRSGVQLEAPPNAKTNVFEFPKPKVGANKLHLAQKPVELMKALIEDCGETGDVILDLFGGSGTTLVVCEELQRVCYMCEIDLFNCDTIRKRWAEQVHGSGCDWKKLTPAL